MVTVRFLRSQGEELHRTLPVRVQDERWERRFVSGCHSGEEQQQSELRYFTLTGYVTGACASVM